MPEQTSHHPAFNFDRLLIGGGWEDDVRVEVGDGGCIVGLEPGGSRDGCERVAGWAVPGVPNVHSHSFQRAMAGLAEGRGPDSFWSWREVMYAFLRHLTPDDVEAITAQLYVEMLKAGFTCVGEFHYLHHEPDGSNYADPAEMSRRIIEAARTTGIGLVHMPAVYECGGFGGSALAGGQRRFRMDPEGARRLHEMLGRASSGPGVQLGWAMHSLRAVSRETIGRIDELVPSHAPVHIHMAEQEREVQECLARRGARPVEWLLARAPVDPRWCLVHSTHVTDGEMEGIAASGAVVGLCPTTEANLGDGLFPLGGFAGRGGRFGIGTDSHVSRSPVEELRLLEYGQRLRSRNRSVPGMKVSAAGDKDVLRTTGGALLAHAWRNGCRALAWNGGGVEVGMRADLAVLNAEHPALAGRNGRQVLDSWVFSGTDNPVRDVMVGGTWMVKDGRHRREEAIRRAFVNAVKGLAGGV